MDFYLFFVGRLLRISHEMQFLQVVRAARKTQKLRLGRVDPCVMRANWSGRKCAMFYRSRRGGLDTGNNMQEIPGFGYTGNFRLLGVWEYLFSFSLCDAAEWDFL